LPPRTHNDGLCFGDGGGESNVILSTTETEAIVQLPPMLVLQYRVTTYVGLLSNNKTIILWSQVQPLMQTNCSQTAQNLGNTLHEFSLRTHYKIGKTYTGLAAEKN
jgi:hypothetical protein